MLFVTNKLNTPFSGFLRMFDEKMATKFKLKPGEKLNSNCCDVCREQNSNIKTRENDIDPVHYTHLTLPPRKDW